ncbi:AAA family ATPase [Chryseobacterium sp. EO14]|uniref:AAA family ATPase n=1 Tax=Chryseobacterium sp. EO14 TaxID=2950551 RepID=UPI00210C82A7|nr:AAA family ATPase [Chryseobacterium sp. EO14]MCQ4139427.1 AAA family ATPase [Chryseobacterium sp. EO14]
MDKRVIFAVAGSGKTTFLINQLNETDRFLLVTYTNNNVHNLRTGIIKKFGYFPSNVKLYSYYSFLYGICYKPFLHDKLRTKGINYDSMPSRFAKSNSREYYIDTFNRLYSGRISKVLFATKEQRNVVERISKYFDHLFIDEIQDFGGNDFNLLKEISKAGVNHIYVGDFYQHTFDTSRDGNTNSTLHDNLKRYVNEFQKVGVVPDTDTLSKSFRCSPTVCKFITDNLSISIESHRTDETEVKYIDNLVTARQIFNDNSIVKLFYREHYNYDCFSRNWGDSKGEDKYFDVCVVLNKSTLDKYSKGKLHELPPTTKNKLYVALSRAKNNLYLIPYNLINEN